MKIGFYVQRVAGAPGFEDVVSAHVQLPLYTMQLLRDHGHDVQLITTRFGSDLTLPNCLPKGTKVHQVSYGTKQGDSLVMFEGNKTGLRPIKLLEQLWQIRRIIQHEKFDILHFSGSSRIAYLAGILAYIGIKSPIILTINVGSFSESFIFLRKILWRRISTIITSTAFFKGFCESKGLNTKLLKHGIIRQINITQELSNNSSRFPNRRVLFWRDPSWENGADLCLQVYKLLAPKFPDVSFELAVRPHWNPVSGLKDLSDMFPNVHLHIFPYENGVTLDHLLSTATCVLLPFRELSTHPQFAVLESMLAGKATITTALESNYELIEHKRNGFLVPVDDIEETAKIISHLVSQPDVAAAIGRQASEDINNAWNWDNYISELISIYEASIYQKKTRNV
ncbi:glycosyltransferase family 4 protein [Candidatus Leptofilum sp.]|uniref:glycosyltransferase family 4 protein n=1 Tax=Candidatus Leptofilum sp. TaxID=3241576 RepID=UPI003B5A619B